MADVLTLIGRQPMDKPPDVPSGLERVFTVEEVSAYLKLNPVTVRGYLHAGILRGVRGGRAGRWRVTESALRAFLRSEDIQ